MPRKDFFPKGFLRARRSLDTTVLAAAWWARFVLSVNPSISIPRTDCLKLGRTAEITHRNHGSGSSHEETVLAWCPCYLWGDSRAGGQQTPEWYDHFRKLSGLRLHAGKGQKEQTAQRRGALPGVCCPHRRHRLPHPASEALRQGIDPHQHSDRIHTRQRQNKIQSERQILRISRGLRSRRRYHRRRRQALTLAELGGGAPLGVSFFNRMRLLRDAGLSPQKRRGVLTNRAKPGATLRLCSARAGGGLFAAGIKVRKAVLTDCSSGKYSATSGERSTRDLKNT